MWLEQFKIALVTKNTDKLGNLISKMPKFEKVQEMQKASYLIKEALVLLHSLKDETQKDMGKLKSRINFIKSFTNHKKNHPRIDFTS